MNKIKGSQLMFITCFIWGANYSMTKIALSGTSTYVFNFLRFLIGAFLLSIVFKDHFKNFDLEIFKNSLVLSLLLFSGATFTAIAINQTTASQVSIYRALQIPIIPFIAYILLKEKLYVKNFFIAFLCFAGIYIMNGSTFILSNGSFLAIIAAISFALHVVFTEKYVDKDDVVLLLIIQSYITAFFSLMIAHMSSTLIFSTISNKIWFFIILTALLTNALANLMQFLAQKKITATKTGIISATTPVFAMLIAFIFVGETISFIQILGAIFIFAAIAISKIHFKLHTKHIKHY